MILLLSGLLLLIAAWFALAPHRISGISSRPDPAHSHEEALRRAERFGGRDRAGMNPLCRLQLMTHGKTASRAVVLVHGYTNCPRQFLELGKLLFESGDNVLIAPLPRHGLLDRMTEEHALLRAEELASYADEVVDIAQGLGGKVVIAGISAGGVTAAWAAQQRDDIDLALVVSPAFGFRKIPAPLTAAAMNLFSVLPDTFVWWNPVLGAEAPPSHAYPRYSRRALAQILRLGFAVRRDMRRTAPGAKKVVVVTNPSDRDVNDTVVQEIVRRWRSGGANLETYEFDVSLGLPHDLISPDHPEGKTGIVYPRLIELMGG